MFRCLFVVLIIIGGCCLGIVASTLPETHAPTLLYRKAKMKRKETGDDPLLRTYREARHHTFRHGQDHSGEAIQNARPRAYVVGGHDIYECEPR